VLVGAEFNMKIFLENFRLLQSEAGKAIYCIL